MGRAPLAGGDASALRARPALGRLLGEAALLLVLGAAAGLARNAARNDSLPLDLAPALLAAESGARAVFPGEAIRLHNGGTTIFVDARSEEEFRAEHISGALSLPVSRFGELYETLQLWSGGQPLLVYAGRGDLLSADELARLLRQAGEENVMVLASGFEGWIARKLPVESGENGILEIEEY